MELYHQQFILNVVPKKHSAILSPSLQIKKQHILFPDFMIDENGMICHIGRNQNLLNEPMTLNVCRAWIDNDKTTYETIWKNFDLSHTHFHVFKTRIRKQEICFEGNLSSRTHHIGKVALTYHPIQHGLKVSLSVLVNDQIPFLPRFGISLNLHPSFKEATYLGYGPEESYIDRHQAGHFGIHSLKVFDKENFFDYPYPQESGSHFHTFTATIHSEKERIQFSSEKPFSFQAIPFKLDEFQDHAYKMNHHFKHCIVNIDYKMSGVGSGSCGPALAKVYQLHEKEFVQEIDIIYKSSF